MTGSLDRRSFLRVGTLGLAGAMGTGLRAQIAPGLTLPPYVADVNGDGLADMADSVKDQSANDMVGTVSDFARRNPLAFLGGAALLGPLQEMMSLRRRRLRSLRHRRGTPHRRRRPPVAYGEPVTETTGV